MQDGNDIPFGCALKVLVALREYVVGIAVGGVGQKCLRLDLRVHRSRENFVKRQPEDIRAEVIPLATARKL
jgi:hypothetical protein